MVAKKQKQGYTKHFSQIIEGVLYFIPRKNTSKDRLNSLSYLGPWLWSEIPDSLRDKRSTQCFGFAYRKFLLLN